MWYIILLITFMLMVVISMISIYVVYFLPKIFEKKQKINLDLAIANSV